MRKDMPKVPEAGQPKRDAAGQFAKSRADRRASGVAAAKPTVITHSEDSTAHTVPPGADNPSQPEPGERRWSRSERSD